MRSAIEVSGRGQLLGEAPAAVDPGDRRLVALLANQVDARRPRWGEGVVADVRARHDGQPLVEQLDQRADDSRLGLAPFTEQDDVVTGQQRGLELGQDRVLVPENRRSERYARRQTVF